MLTEITAIQDVVKRAAGAGTPLRIRAGGSKDFYGGEPKGDVLDVSGYSGIVDYEPKELVLTVRAGTPLAELEAAMAKDNQMLPFEPPRFTPSATIGGTVAAGLSGPRRAYAGAVRDFVLGVRMVNGKGEDLSFGGRVIKNVAGYDASRLMCGALGTLGVITEISFKVLPRPAAETTLRFEMSEAQAIQAMNTWAGKPLPLSATAFSNGVLMVRLSGATSAVATACDKLGGERVDDAAALWNGLRDHTHAFFRDANTLWRVSVKQTAPPLGLEQPQMMEWGGGLRWLAGDADAARLRALAQERGGHATLFRGGDKRAGVFHPLEPAVMKIHRNLKQAFDPAGILNPGRMYAF